ncbi:MAG: alpha-galactosidase [Clostridiales bacterium]|nr:alpha-galactosidase [Clostridiales bacterium]
MGITYYEDSRVFKLDTPNTSYMIQIVDEEGFLGHMYYGAKLPDTTFGDWLRTKEYPFIPSKNNRERLAFLDALPMEYPTHGVGDFRLSALEIKTQGGHHACSITYFDHKIYKGKPNLTGLPATFGSDEECETLELTCKDSVLNLTVILNYTVFEDVDVITRSAKVVNEANQPIKLLKVLSASFDLEDDNYELITLHGAWARERMVERRKIAHGIQGVSSSRGETSQQEHPFLSIVNKTTTEDYGEAYGINFVYSGNFIAQAEKCSSDLIRIAIGINPVNFEWNLDPGEIFTSPEAVMVYSNQGIGQMSRTFHDLYRNHLIRGKYKDSERPILINNWEATYFDFNTDKLLDIARNAARLGIEMLVMDDGWFGKRNDDNTSLGDWYVNEEKLPGGLNYLVEEINKLGMKFGIWMEPEMVSKDSDLYREHPDWAIQVPNRTAALGRNQYVLDLSRKEVRDYIYERIRSILHSANIAYLKWDMNRPLTDLGSYALDEHSQGELSHRYVLGVYELQERLISEFPDLLLENCSSGGARFDPGMLYYSPQIWCSDDTDAIERLKIQRGTSMIYPLSTMGAHVSDCPNHALGRNTPFETRGYVALSGTFGYELDVTKISEEDQNKIPEQVAMYHKYNQLIRSGDYYRIASMMDDPTFDCTMVVAKDKSEALVTYIQVMARVAYRNRRIHLKGLEENSYYLWEETGEVYSGAVYMNVGITMDGLWGDYQGKLIHLIRQ